MFILSIATAVPRQPIPQKETLDFVLSRFSVRERTKQLYKKTLSNTSIATRHFSLESLEQVLDQNHDTKIARFEKESVALSTQSLMLALNNAHVSPRDIDFLAVTTCTGYMCPGISAYLIESCGLRSDVRTVDLVGMGCGAALPALEQARNYLSANPGKKAAVVCTEICSATMVSNDDIDIIISNTIFADGSAAVILSDEKNLAGEGGLRFHSFGSLIIPEWRESLRFRTEAGHLKNVLEKKVPQQAAEAMGKITKKLLAEASLKTTDIQHWIMHAGGEKIINEIQRELALSNEDLQSSRRVLKDFGNMSSPTVLFVLAEEMRSTPPQKGQWGVMGSFGAGFSAYGALLQWT